MNNTEYWSVNVIASIQKRGKTYQYTVSNMVNGKSEPIRKGGFRTKKEARLAAAEIEVMLGKDTEPQTKPVPIDEYFDKWVILYKTHLSKTTQQHYKYTSRAIKAYWGSKPLQKIKRHEYQLFLNDYGSTRSKESVEKLNSHIRACVKDAIEEHIIDHDFTRKAVITWKVPSKKNSDKYLDFEESRILLNEINNRLNNGLIFSLLLLGLTSGMRFGELIGLTKKDFDFSNNTIRINKTWGYLKRHNRGFAPTKNEQSNRTIKMDIKTMKHFNELLDKIPSNENQLVFYCSYSKYKVISNAAANTQLKQILQELGFTKISMHGLRHSHASILFYKKVSIYYISERLGHSNIETTLKEYAHLTKELRKEDEEKMIKTFLSITES